MKSYGYAIDVTCNDIRAEVWLNDFLVHATRDDERRVVQQKINAYAYEGKNVIRARLRTSETASPGPLGPRFELRFLRGEHEVEGEEPKVLYYLRWEPDELPIARDAFTEILHHEWIFAEGFGRWAFQDATPYMPEDRPAIEALLGRVHAALVARDVDTYFSFIDVKTSELARSTRSDPAQNATEQRGFIRMLMSQPGYFVWPFDPRDLVLTSNATGRLVEVTRADGAPPLRIQVEDFGLGIGATVSKLGGRWTIVR